MYLFVGISRIQTHRLLFLFMRKISNPHIYWYWIAVNRHQSEFLCISNRFPFLYRFCFFTLESVSRYLLCSILWAGADIIQAETISGKKGISEADYSSKDRRICGALHWRLLALCPQSITMPLLYFWLVSVMLPTSSSLSARIEDYWLVLNHTASSFALLFSLSAAIFLAVAVKNQPTKLDRSLSKPSSWDSPNLSISI